MSKLEKSFYKINLSIWQQLLQLLFLGKLNEYKPYHNTVLFRLNYSAIISEVCKIEDYSAIFQSSVKGALRQLLKQMRQYTNENSRRMNMT